MSWSKRFRHYNNLEKTEERLERLLEDFSFTIGCGSFSLEPTWRPIE